MYFGISGCGEDSMKTGVSDNENDENPTRLELVALEKCYQL
jgi:hypothetical protein